MKKARYRKRMHCISHESLSFCVFFASEGRKMNSRKTILTFSRKRDGVVARVTFYDDVKFVVVNWFDHRFYAFPYLGRKSAKPYTMSLAKYKQLNDFEK